MTTTTKPTTKPRLTTSAMIASFADPGQKTAPAPFGHALARLAEERPEIVGLSADLAKYTDMHVFREAHPDRFFQMGMAEQAMLGAAAGLAEVGLVPFASTYSVFATRRAYDFLCLDIAEPNLNVNIVGALPGLTTGYGPSHQATEDLAILREAARTGRMVVVAENHTIMGGLGEAVAGLLLRSGVTPAFRQVALPDEFLDAGALPTLHERYGISANAMARNIKTWLSH